MNTARKITPFPITNIVQPVNESDPAQDKRVSCYLRMIQNQTDPRAREMLARFHRQTIQMATNVGRIGGAA